MGKTKASSIPARRFASVPGYVKTHVTKTPEYTHIKQGVEILPTTELLPTTNNVDDEKRNVLTLQVPMCFPTMTEPDEVTVLEWYFHEGDIIEPPVDLDNLPPLLNIDAPYQCGSEILIPVPQFLSVPHRVVSILKPVQATMKLGDPFITLEPLESNAA
jgi:hypothetical protein